MSKPHWTHARLQNGAMLSSLLLLLTVPLAGFDEALLATRIGNVEVESKGTLGVAVVDLASGQSWSYRGQERFPMQSTYKFPIGCAVMAQVDAGKLKLDQKITIREGDLSVPLSAISQRFTPPEDTYTLRELLEAMVGSSDNTAADVLLKLAGGPKAVQAYLNRHGVGNVRVDRYEKEFQPQIVGLGRFQKEWAKDEGFSAAMAKVPRERRIQAMLAYFNDPRDTSTPNAMAELLRKFERGDLMSPDSKATLWEIMTATRTGRNRLKAGIPEGAVVTHKTGTAREMEGICPATNDVGIVTLPSGRRVVIVAFLKASKAAESTREGAIADVARSVVASLR